jgi:serine/threonine protein kinase
MITFLCSHCGAPLRVRPELGGATAPCPRCGRAVQAPLDSSGTEGGAAASPTRPSGSRETRLAFETVAAARDSDLDFLGPPQAPDELGRLGPYRVLKVLGAGAFGLVFQAEDTVLKRQVALKVMKKTQAANEVNRLRFLREAQAAAAIEHDHIVTIYQVDEDRGVPFIAMKLLLGESLEDRLNREVKLPVEEVLRIGQEIAEGMAEAHERGLIHRDIKPANIWLEEGRDRVKIVDFGLALACNEEDARLTQSNYMVGTPMYMSPEQAEADVPVDHRCDLFSLGGVLYRMSTGELPFKGKTTMAVLTALATKEPRPPIDLNPDLPPALSDLILNLLSKKADDRPRTARLVVAALAELREAPGSYEEVEEEPEEIEEPEEEVIEAPVVAAPRPRPKRHGGRREKPRTDETKLERRVIGLAICAAVFVLLLLAALVIKNRFFPPKLEGIKPQTGAPGALLAAGSIAGSEQGSEETDAISTWRSEIQREPSGWSIQLHLARQQNVQADQDIGRRQGDRQLRHEQVRLGQPGGA